MQYDLSVVIRGYLRVHADNEKEAYSEADAAMVQMQDEGDIKDFKYYVCECIPVVRED